MPHTIKMHGCLCFVTLVLLCRGASAISGKVTSEWTLSSDTGGGWQSTSLVASGDGFCFLTTMTRLDGTHEGCHLTIGEIVGHTGEYWILNQKSNNGDGSTICGARCFLTQTANTIELSDERTLSNDNGGTWDSEDLDAPANSSFCGLTQATRLDGSNEGCWVNWGETVGRTGQWWILQEKANNGGGSTACSSRCVRMPGQSGLAPFGFTKLEADTGGSWSSATLTSSASNMCFLLGATQLDGVNEGCSIVEEEVVGHTGYFWILRQKSNNDAGSTACSAACFSYDAPGSLRRS